jgi:hypothetical protein
MASNTLTGMASNNLTASCQCPPFAQAVMSALYVMVSRWTRTTRMTSITLAASCHYPPFVHAVMSVLYVTVLTRT